MRNPCFVTLESLSIQNLSCLFRGTRPPDQAADQASEAIADYVIHFGQSEAGEVLKNFYEGRGKDRKKENPSLRE